MYALYYLHASLYYYLFWHYLCIPQVPSRDSDITPEEALSQFHNDIPVLALIGTEYKVKPEVNYTVDEDVQLVCKYLNALRSGEIDRLCEDGE